MASDARCVGCVGALTIGTRGADGPGEVLIRERGGTESYIAYSAQPLTSGTTVLITTYRGARAVDVIAWDALGGELYDVTNQE